MKKEKYIEEINTLLNGADIDLLDFVYQLLQKSVDMTPFVNPSKERPQSA